MEKVQNLKNSEIDSVTALECHRVAEQRSSARSVMLEAPAKFRVKKIPTIWSVLNDCTRMKTSCQTLHSTVFNRMVHGPCSEINLQSSHVRTCSSPEPERPRERRSNPDSAIH
jgi:hypothetical protein